MGVGGRRALGPGILEVGVPPVDNGEVIIVPGVGILVLFVG